MRTLPRNPGRRGALATMAGLAALSCLSVPAGAAEAPALLPWRTLTGALESRLLPTPDGRQRRRPVFVRFAYPVAVAARGMDIHVADAGQGRVWRYDQILDRLIPFPGILANTTTRLAAGRDLSLYVLDGGGRRVLRYTREGSPLAVYADPVNLAQPVDLAVDEAHGVLLVADAAWNRITVFNSLGRVIDAWNLGREGGGLAVSAVAAGPDSVYVADRLGGQVIEFSRQGRYLGTLAAGLGEPTALAADESGWLFVAERRGRRVLAFARGRPAGEAPMSFPIPGAMALDGGLLYVADPQGGRVEALRVVRPAEAA